MTTLDLSGATLSPASLAPVSRGRAGRDRAARLTMWSAFGLALVPLGWILFTVVRHGWSLLATSTWWTYSQRNINASDAGGGAVHAIQGTLIQGAATAAISVPIALLTAIYLVEYGRTGSRLARIVSFAVDILSGVPSIVAALFVYAVWVTTFGFRRVPIAVCLALVLLMIPVVVRSTEEMLKLVPAELREASAALGIQRWVTITKVVLPTAFSGIVTGILLGLARVLGETAPLLILGPYTKGIATNLFAGSMPTLPTMINQDRTETGLDTAVTRMWATALTLILLVLVLNLAARRLTRRSATHRTPTPGSPARRRQSPGR